jgi:hypothetical protein
MVDVAGVAGAGVGRDTERDLEEEAMRGAFEKKVLTGENPVF